MTGNTLLCQLTDEVRKILRDMRWKDGRIKIYGQTLPQNLFFNDDDGDTLLPCCLVKIMDDTVTDFTKPPSISVGIGIVTNISCPDSLGAMDVNNALERIRERFCKNAYLGNFEATAPIRITLSDEDTYPYYGGELTMTFLGRRIEREDPLA